MMKNCLTILIKYLCMRDRFYTKPYKFQNGTFFPQCVYDAVNKETYNNSYCIVTMINPFYFNIIVNQMIILYNQCFVLILIWRIERHYLYHFDSGD